jgi:hypothetical protein
VPQALQPSPAQWSELAAVVELLRPFYNITRLMCASTFLSLSWFGATINAMLAHCRIKVGGADGDTLLIRTLKGRLEQQVC